MSSHHHAQAPGRSSAATHRRALTIVLVLVASFVAVELAAGVLAGSLALVSDAGHMATDAVGVAMALTAINIARRGTANPSTTFGHYRWEVIAALANAALLLGVCVYVVIEAIDRLQHPQPMDAIPVLVVAAAGLAINVVSFRLLHRGAKESLNVRGAYVEVMADMFGSIGVIVSASVVLLTGWPYADPIVALALAAFIAPRALRLGRDALRIITQQAPRDVDVRDLTAHLASIDGVAAVHDVHAWTLTSGMNVASVHLVSDTEPASRVLDAAHAVLREFALEHATVQIESADARDVCRSAW
jgi:cobalt-zinc-cadmium efflux system protein